MCIRDSSCLVSLHKPVFNASYLLNVSWCSGSGLVLRKRALCKRVPGIYGYLRLSTVMYCWERETIHHTSGRTITNDWCMQKPASFYIHQSFFIVLPLVWCMVFLSLCLITHYSVLKSKDGVRNSVFVGRDFRTLNSIYNVFQRNRKQGSCTTFRFPLMVVGETVIAHRSITTFLIMDPETRAEPIYKKDQPIVL